jgi:glycosyltransferase involved in cell wall biosynthesis
MSEDEIISGIFNDSFHPITDGVAMVTKNYAYWLNRIAGPSCVVTTDMPSHYDAEDFPVYRYISVPLPSRPPYRVGVSFVGEVVEKRLRGRSLKERLSTNLFSMPFHILHAHCPFSSGDVALRIARTKHVPLVATFHTKYRNDFEATTKSRLLVDVALARVVSFYKSADYVWVPSADTIDVMREYGYNGRVDVMPNGTDLIVSDAELPVLRAEGEKALGVPPGTPALLYIGQHIKEKNLDNLVESLGVARRLGGKFRMIFIGDGHYRKALEARVAELGISDVVMFKGVVRDREYMKRAYARADLLFFPSLYDTSSLIVKEAAGMRLASLLVKGSTTSEGVTDGKNGFLAENDPEDLARRLIAALADPDGIRRAGIGAYSSLYRSWENVITEVAERYRAIIRDWSY